MEAIPTTKSMSSNTPSNPTTTRHKGMFYDKNGSLNTTSVIVTLIISVIVGYIIVQLAMIGAIFAIVGSILAGANPWCGIILGLLVVIVVVLGVMWLIRRFVGGTLGRLAANTVGATAVIAVLFQLINNSMKKKISSPFVSVT